MTEGTLLDEVKVRLGITGNYHDGLLTAYAEDVKGYMKSGGVPQTVIDSPESYGCIARGVADLWNYGSGDGRFSEVFYQRVTQLALPGELTADAGDIEPITQDEIDQAIVNTIMKGVRNWQT